VRTLRALHARGMSASAPRAIEESARSNRWWLPNLYGSGADAAGGAPAPEGSPAADAASPSDSDRQCALSAPAYSPR
jgi:hypothetical protein